MKILEVAIALLKSKALCDNCLGRQFALLAHGLTNDMRGRAIKLILVVEGHRLALRKNEEGEQLLQAVAVNGFSELATQTLKILGLNDDKMKQACYLCEGIFNCIEEVVEQVIKMLTDYEFATILVGVRMPKDIEDREDELCSKFKIEWGESIRSELSREIGKKVVEATSKIVDYKRPDILVLVNPFTRHVTLKINSLFVGGRYNKLVRGIPQAKWICRNCEGQGCTECSWTGKTYQESVEELIAEPILKETRGSDSKFHAAGREDVDARVLGSGRPFIIEIKNPRRRFVDLGRLQKEINKHALKKVKIKDLNFSSKDDVRRIKSQGQAEKVYRAIVKFEKELSNDELSRIKEELSNKQILQMTPSRVLHRRANRARKKYLYEVKIRRLGPSLVEMIVRVQGGLYVKELITGDEGRTTPNVSSIADIPAKCVELDVMEVGCERMKGVFSQTI